MASEEAVGGAKRRQGAGPVKAGESGLCAEPAHGKTKAKGQGAGPRGGGEAFGSTQHPPPRPSPVKPRSQLTEKVPFPFCIPGVSFPAVRYDHHNLNRRGGSVTDREGDSGRRAHTADWIQGRAFWEWCWRRKSPKQFIKTFSQWNLNIKEKSDDFLEQTLP